MRVKLFDPLIDTVKYYKRNLYRFTRMVQNGEIEKLLRPGKFLSEPPNNLELILRYKDAHFEGFINSTKNKYDFYCYPRDKVIRS